MKDYIIELKCEDNAERKYERRIELNSWESAVDTFYTIAKGTKDLTTAFSLTMVGGGTSYIFKKEYNT